MFLSSDTPCALFTFSGVSSAICGYISSMTSLLVFWAKSLIIPFISSLSNLSGEISRSAAIVWSERVFLSSSAILSSLDSLSSHTSLAPVSDSISLAPLIPSCFMMASGIPTATVNSPNRSSALFSVTGTSTGSSAFFISVTATLNTFSNSLLVFISIVSFTTATNLLTSFSVPVTLIVNLLPVSAPIAIMESWLTCIPAEAPPVKTALMPDLATIFLSIVEGLICKPRVLTTSKLRVASVSASVPSTCAWSNSAFMKPSSSPATSNSSGEPSLGAVTDTGAGASASATISPS